MFIKRLYEKNDEKYNLKEYESKENKMEIEKKEVKAIYRIIKIIRYV